MKKLLALLPLILSCLNAHAENWEDIGEDKLVNIHYSIDYDTVDRLRDPIRLGIKDSFVTSVIKHTYTDEHPLKDKGYSYSKNFYIVNCSSNKGGYVYIPYSLFYNVNDQIVDKHVNENYSNKDFIDTPVDTMTRLTWAETCMRNIYNHNTGKYR